MLPFQLRVIEEKSELDARLDRLQKFLAGSVGTVPAEERSRLREQARVMYEYSHILGRRIAAFTGSNG